MQIEIQLDEERAKKLAYIQQETHQNAAEVLQQAIDRSYEQLTRPTQSPADQTALEIFQASNFIGSIEASPDLSVRYKDILRDTIQQKFDRDREA